MPSCSEPVGGVDTVDNIPVGEFSGLPFGEIMNYGTGAAVLVALILLMVGGFGVTTSAGDPEKLQKAKSQITAAISGLVFIFASILILNIIGGIIGIGSFPFD